MITSPAYTVFNVPKRELKLLGNGIGIGKGVINGLIAISRADIDALKDRGQPLILVRPDTVPEDMELLFDCQGLLTSRGGVTSHAAVTAIRLGLVGIVNCRQLKVFEDQNNCRTRETLFKPGDEIAIDAKQRRRTWGTTRWKPFPDKNIHKIHKRSIA